MKNNKKMDFKNKKIIKKITTIFDLLQKLEDIQFYEIKISKYHNHY